MSMLVDVFSVAVLFVSLHHLIFDYILCCIQ